MPLRHFSNRPLTPIEEEANSEQSERRIRHIETLLEQQRRIAAELEQVDDETRREVEEGLRHERSVTQMIAQSEPTTPPEYQDPFPSTYALIAHCLSITDTNLHYRRSISPKPLLDDQLDVTSWRCISAKSFKHSVDFTSC